MRAILIAALMALSACASGPPPSTEIADTSYVEANGKRAIRLSVWLPVRPSAVYRLIATVDGWKAWAAAHAFGEVKPDGVLETSYALDAKPGDPANIKQQFVSLIPDRLVIFRTIQTPPGFPHAELFKETVTAIELTPDSDGTHLRFTHAGFGDGADWDELYAFFRPGDRQTLEALQKALGLPKPAL